MSIKKDIHKKHLETTNRIVNDFPNGYGDLNNKKNLNFLNIGNKEINFQEKNHFSQKFYKNQENEKINQENSSNYKNKKNKFLQFIKNKSDKTSYAENKNFNNQTIYNAKFSEMKTTNNLLNKENISNFFNFENLKNKNDESDSSFIKSLYSVYLQNPKKSEIENIIIKKEEVFCEIEYTNAKGRLSNLKLYDTDLERLNPPNYLNDNLIFFYLK